jgi:hypothetical protein
MYSFFFLEYSVIQYVTQQFYCQFFLQNEKHKSVTNSKEVGNVCIV